MPEFLWKVRFIGGPKDGDTKKLPLEGRATEYVAESDRDGSLHTYYFENTDIQHKTMDAVYAGAKKYV